MKIFLRIFCLMGVVSTAFSSIHGAYNAHFAVEGDYVYLKRTRSHNHSLVSSAGAEETTLITTQDLAHDMGFDSGFSLALKIFPSLNTTWEGRYLGGLSWQGEKTSNDPKNLNLDGTLRDQTRDYEFADEAKTIYDSRMHTWELNLWRHITPRYTDHFSVSWLIGFRMFDINEKIKLSFHKDDRVSRYRIKTANAPFGLQLGGDIQYNPYHFLTWGFVVKVGGMFNRGSQKTKMFDDNNTVEILDSDKSRSNFAYMLEAYPFIELRPSKHFFFTINYRALYVGSIATADQNTVLDHSKPSLNNSGNILYHGLTGSIQFNF